MSGAASLEDILSLLNLGTDFEDRDLTDELRTHFGVPDDVQLATFLSATPPGEVLAAIGSAVAPIAAMVRQIYEWLGRIFDVQATGNLTVQASGDDLRAMNMDPAHYTAYERQVVESVASTGFHPARLPADTILVDLYDLHWPPACSRKNPAPTRCGACLSGVPERFATLERLLRVAASAHIFTPVQPFDRGDRRAWLLDNLPRLVDDVTNRDGLSPCSFVESHRVESHRADDYLHFGLPDLEACFGTISTDELRTFFEMPYWKARWQVFEIWILRLVLDTSDDRSWAPSLSGDLWDLRAGSTNTLPVATAYLPGDRELRCYYQHESIPPAPLVAGTRDRPEILVTTALRSAPARPGSADEPVLLAVEAKARRSMAYQEMTNASLALLAWRPARILGASLYKLTKGGSLHLQTYGDTAVAMVEGLVPDSDSHAQTSEWLRTMWNDLVPVRIAIVAVDVSGSMPVDAAITTLHSMAEMLHCGDTGDWLDSLRGADFLLLATFGGEVSRLVLVPEISPSAIAETGVSLTPVKGSRPLAAAVARWQRQVNQSDRAPWHWDVHLVTDARLSDGDVVTFEQFAVDGIDAFVHSFTGAGRIRHALRARLTLHTEG